MSTILAHIVVKEGREGAFEALAVELFRGSHGNETALRAYGYWRGAEERHYYTLLAFDDYLGFLVHQSSDHHEIAASGLRECIETMSLEWVDPVEGASLLAPTNPMGIPADSSARMHHYAARLPPTVANWWFALRDHRSIHREGPTL